MLWPTDLGRPQNLPQGLAMQPHLLRLLARQQPVLELLDILQLP